MQSSADWKGLILSQGSKIEEKQIARLLSNFPLEGIETGFCKGGGK